MNYEDWEHPEEIERLNELTRPARERYCRRQWLIHAAIQWSGWLVAGLMTMANFAIRVG